MKGKGKVKGKVKVIICKEANTLDDATNVAFFLSRARRTGQSHE